MKFGVDDIVRYYKKLPDFAFKLFIDEQVKGLDLSKIDYKDQFKIVFPEGSLSVDVSERLGLFSKSSVIDLLFNI